MGSVNSDNPSPPPKRSHLFPFCPALMGSILSSYSSFPAPRPPASDGHILATGEFSPPVPASPASGSSFYRISSTCTFDLPLDGPDATTADYFFRARGSTSEGDVVIEMIEAEDGEKAASGIRVVIEARYQDPDELEAVTLCLLAKVEGGPARGVGLYVRLNRISRLVTGGGSWTARTHPP